MSPAKRSHLMSTIKSKNTKPEIILRLLLRQLNIRYRLDSKLPGKPDMKIVGAKIVIFVDGCFWHGCSKHYKQPSSNTSFWIDKVEKNRARDRRNYRKLNKLGYKVIRIWEHELEDMPKLLVKLKKKFSGHSTVANDAKTAA